jgi:predicted dehydrogenase
MSDKPFKVALIGTGMIANAGHIPAWKNLGADVEIVAVANQTGPKARLTAEKEGIPRVYVDWQKMLDEVEPDIVSVCTPNVYHKEHTIAALKAGAHVLCEKPVATCYADALEMFETAEAVGRVLFVSQTVRFSSRAFAAKEIVESGKLGEMYFAETYFMRRRGVPTWGRFHMKEHSAAGPLYDIGVHLIDKIFWLMGNPRAVAASGVTYTKFGNRDEGLVTSLAESGAPLGVLIPRPYDYREFDVEDMAAGFIRLERDAVIAFKTSWAANVPQNVGGNMILGTEGGLMFDPPVLVTNMGRYQVDVTPKVPRDHDVPFYGHWLAAEHFVRVLRGQEELMVRKEEVLNVMKALDALYRSAEEGREVRVD